MKTNVMLKCSQCGHEMNVDELLVSQFQESIKKDLLDELSARESEFKHQKLEYDKLVIKLSKEKKQLDKLINSKVNELLQSKEEPIKEAIRKQIQEEKAKEFHESAMKLREKETIISQLKDSLEEAKRKAEQGSMQLQGEIQELEILDLLQEFHPHDTITKSKKGVNGADILQVVQTNNGIECGKIYYESKRTKSWSNDWVKKFKHDNLNAKADILVIVTNVLPKEIQRYGIIDGIWVCSFNDVKELSLVLRYGLLKLQSVAISQQGKGTKMELLYNYLTSEEFKNVFESIIEGFKNIQDSHQSEKLKMQRLWKEREKIIEQVLSNSIEFYGSIKGIAGNAIHEIPMLKEFPKAN